MFNKLFKAIFATALVVGSALGFVACEEKEKEVTNPSVEVSVKSLSFSNEEETQSVDVTANGDWKVTIDYITGEDWVIVTPAAGNGNATLQVSVPMNNSGAIREATVKVIALHPVYGNWDVKKIKVAQSSDEKPAVTETLLYGDNFDGKEATKTYGSGSSWPYIDQFPEFANAEGPASENVTYSGSGVSVRANSTSNSNYSDYAGSGSNNIFFGASAYFQINDIALNTEQSGYKVTFGAEKYTQDGDSTFNPDEFKMYLSKDGSIWSEVEFNYAGTEPGRWNMATANFTLKEVPEALYIKFTASVASVYRLDDVQLYTGNGGQVVDLENGSSSGGNGGEKPAPDTDAYYFDNFDGKEATKTYGSGSSWPYIDQFPEFANAVGSAAGSVTYTGKAVSVRNNSNSNGTYSDYAGSGLNNIFFGADAYFQVNGIALASDQKNLKLTFGTEKYSQDNGSKFTPSEFHVLLSADGEKWSEIEYTFAGTTDGRWNVATADLTLASVPLSLYIKFVVDVASSYRLDDLSLAAGNGGQNVDLANGSENPGGGEEPENPEQPEGPDQPVVPGQGEFASDSIFVCSVDDSNNGVYSLKATAINGESATGFKLGTSTKTGVFTSQAVGTEGNMTLGFYAVAWKNVAATLYVKVDNGAVESFELAPNDGATSNPPYNALSFKESDHYTINLTGLTASSKISFSTSPDFKVVESAAPRAILCGVKLISEQGSEPEPEPEIVTLATPEVTATVADGKVTVKWGAIENAASYDVTFDGKTTNVKATEYVFDAPAAEAEAKKYTVSVVAKPAEGTNFTASAAGKAEFTIDAKVDEPETPGDEPETPGDEPETPGDDIVYTSVADFLAAEVNDSKYYYLKGTITRVANTSYGNFDLTDDTGTVYIYGLNSEDGSTTKYWETSGAKLGDDIVIYATRAEFNGSAQGGNARFVELTSPGTRAFWSFSKDAVVFGSAAGEQVITVEAYNLTANVVASSDNDQFAVSYANGALTISAKENTTTEVINGKITVESGALKQVITVAQNGVSVGGGTEVEAAAVMADQGWANGTAVSEVKLDNNVKVVFDQGSAANAPAYYTTGNAVRLYQNGATMTVSANGKTIKSMEITFADGHYYMAPDCGEFSAEGAVRVWTGEATEVVFTTTGTDKSHRAYIAEIKVTYID